MLDASFLPPRSEAASNGGKSRKRYQAVLDASFLLFLLFLHLRII